MFIAMGTSQKMDIHWVNGLSAHPMDIHWVCTQPIDPLGLQLKNGRVIVKFEVSWVKLLKATETL
jgi:hypothetical protein